MGDLLKALSNATNQKILSALRTEPTYPRKIAALLDLPETVVARRLKQMEGLRLVTSAWAYIGKNVKLYKLAVPKISIKFGPEGLHVDLGREDVPERAEVRDALRPHIPNSDDLVGREPELEILHGPDPVVFVEGMPGIGKTTLLAFYAERCGPEENLFWHGFRGIESINWLANRLAIFYKQHGDGALFKAVEARADVTDKIDLMLEGFDKADLTFIFDDVHRIEEPEVRQFVEEATARGGKAKLVLAGREGHAFAGAGAHVRGVRLEGLSDKEVRGLLRRHGAHPTTELIHRLRRKMGGHPLALHLVLEASRQLGRPIEDVLENMPETNLEEYLLQEIDGGLEDSERRVLSMASLFRDRFTVDDLRTVSTKIHEAHVMKLRRRHLVQQSEQGYSLHEIIRSFFYRLVADPKPYHLKIAQHFLDQGSIEGRIGAMHHFEAAGKRDRVLDLLAQNLDLHEFDFIDAGYTSLYLRALESLAREEVTNPERWALIQDEKGDIHFQSGKFREALRFYKEAKTLFEAASDQERVDDLGWKQALAYAELGKQDLAKRTVKDALKKARAKGEGRRRLQRLLKELESGNGTAEGSPAERAKAAAAATARKVAEAAREVRRRIPGHRRK